MTPRRVTPVNFRTTVVSAAYNREDVGASPLAGARWVVRGIAVGCRAAGGRRGRQQRFEAERQGDERDHASVLESRAGCAPGPQCISVAPSMRRRRSRRLCVRSDRPGVVTARSTFEVAQAGPFSGQLRLPPRALPGRYSLRVSGTSGAATLAPARGDRHDPGPAGGRSRPRPGRRSAERALADLHGRLTARPPRRASDPLHEVPVPLSALGARHRGRLEAALAQDRRQGLQALQGRHRDHRRVGLSRSRAATGAPC